MTEAKAMANCCCKCPILNSEEKKSANMKNSYHFSLKDSPHKIPCVSLWKLKRNLKRQNLEQSSDWNFGSIPTKNAGQHCLLWSNIIKTNVTPAE